MKRQNKKAFTLVELLVVIAILAVLSTVAIVGYSSFTRKANISNDTTLVAQLNLWLQANEGEAGKYSTAYEAIKEIDEETGINLADLNLLSTKDYFIGFDVYQNRVVLLKNLTTSGDYKEAPANYQARQDADIFVPLKASKMANNAIFSTYLLDAPSDGIVNASRGLDVGDVTGITQVNYTNTNAAQDVVIRTKGEDIVLNINANKDTVRHYGFVGKLNVAAIANESYHEYGSIGELNMQNGHIVIESGAIVFNVASVGTNVSVDQSKGTVLSVADSAKTSFSSSSVLKINNYAELLNFRDATNSGQNFKGITVELNSDITLEEDWIPMSNWSRIYVYDKDRRIDAYAKDDNGNDKFVINKLFAGTFDGKNHTIYNLHNSVKQATNINKAQNNNSIPNTVEVTYGLFASLGDATIKNLILKDVNIQQYFDENETFVGDCVGAVAGFVFGSATFDNIQVYGNIIASDNVGGIAGRVYNCSSSKFDVKFIECINNINIETKASTGKAGGIATTTYNDPSSFTQQSQKGSMKVTFTQCVNNGTITVIDSKYKGDIYYSGNESQIDHDINGTIN